jgi:DNA segregation ATPase FtsK/SpoIIIE-like protein
MEELGIVSEPHGQKPRDVLMTLKEWQEKLERVKL